MITIRIPQNLNPYEARDIFLKYYLEQELRRFDGSVASYAKALGVDRSNIHKKIHELGIDYTPQGRGKYKRIKRT